jgi:hypothetical protein
MNSPPSQTSIPAQMTLSNQNKAHQKSGSGQALDNQSVSSLNMSRLVGNPGAELLRYITSPEFGEGGESQKLYEIILVSHQFRQLIYHLSFNILGIN